MNLYAPTRQLSDAEFEAAVREARGLRAAAAGETARVRAEHVATNGLSTTWASDKTGIHSPVAAAVRDVYLQYGRHPTFSEMLRRLWRPSSSGWVER